MRLFLALLRVVVDLLWVLEGFDDPSVKSTANDELDVFFGKSR